MTVVQRCALPISAARVGPPGGRPPPDARRKLIRANVIGIGDFVIAVATGIMTSEGFAHILAHDTPNIVNLHPLAMFPGFFVPLFLGFHLVLISRLRQRVPQVVQVA